MTDKEELVNLLENLHVDPVVFTPPSDQIHFAPPATPKRISSSSLHSLTPFSSFTTPGSFTSYTSFLTPHKPPPGSRMTGKRLKVLYPKNYVDDTEVMDQEDNSGITFGDLQTVSMEGVTGEPVILVSNVLETPDVMGDAAAEDIIINAVVVVEDAMGDGGGDGGDGGQDLGQDGGEDDGEDGGGDVGADDLGNDDGNEDVQVQVLKRNYFNLISLTPPSVRFASRQLPGGIFRDTRRLTMKSSFSVTLLAAPTAAQEEKIWSPTDLSPSTVQCK